MGSKKKVIGKCRLCHAEGTELVRSHFIASFAYDSMNEGKPPVSIKKTGVKHLSEQITARLFCGDCENDHLNKKGEQYVSKIAYRGKDPFPLEEILKAHNKICVRCKSNPAIREYDLEKIPGVNQAALIHFALSTVYRSVIWSIESPEISSVNLSPQVLEDLRLFLLGKRGMPEQATIQLILVGSPENAVQPNLRGVTFFPYRRRIDLNRDLNWQGYTPIEFLVAGLAFNVEVGDRVPSEVAKDSLFPGKKIYRIPSNQLSLNARALNALSDAVDNTLWTPHGYLKK